ncbi:isoleucine--tRNA ligase domain protein [Serratia marcescens]|nr:isoleucine--tRNA ligase domain protein [Serratia marcescens]
MQNEGFFALFGSTNHPVQILFIPTLQHARFALGEIAAHREPCFRQVQGILVVTHEILVSVFGYLPVTLQAASLSAALSHPNHLPVQAHRGSRGCRRDATRIV